MRGGDHLRATGGARAVVFLHGIGAGAEMFAPQIAALGRSCDAIGWNLPGYGGHDLDGEMTFEGLSAALLAFLDRLHLARVDLVGHSIGGMLAQAFVARHPERVRTLVLSATTAAFGSRDGSFQKQFVADRLAPLDAGRRMPELAAEFVPGLVGSRAVPLPASQPIWTFMSASVQTTSVKRTSIDFFEQRQMWNDFFKTIMPFSILMMQRL